MRAEKQKEEKLSVPVLSLSCPFFVFFGKCSEKNTSRMALMVGNDLTL